MTATVFLVDPEDFKYVQRWKDTGNVVTGRSEAGNFRIEHEHLVAVAAEFLSVARYASGGSAPNPNDLPPGVPMNDDHPEWPAPGDTWMLVEKLKRELAAETDVGKEKARTITRLKAELAEYKLDPEQVRRQAALARAKELLAVTSTVTVDVYELIQVARFILTGNEEPPDDPEVAAVQDAIEAKKAERELAAKGWRLAGTHLYFDLAEQCAQGFEPTPWPKPTETNADLGEEDKDELD